MSEMMPEEPLNPRQAAEKAALEAIVESVGPFDQTAGPDGAHYAPAADNPFAAQGLVCSNCVFYDGAQRCDIVAGTIEPGAICKLWIIPGNLVTASEASTMETVTFEGMITAADVPNRTIRGLIVPFGKVGNTSAGPVQFNMGAFGDIAPENVVLNTEHDRTRPIGRGIAGSQEISPAGVSMAFKIAPTTAGTDALIEASEGLRPAFSIEAIPNEYDIKAGVMQVSKATLVGVAHVTHPAFEDAQITQVAASDPETPEAESAAEETPTQEETMPDNDIDAAEAAAPVVQATVGAARTAPRSPITSQASYLEHKVRASILGDHESAQYVAAADAEAAVIMAANDSFTTNPAFTPVSYVGTVVDTLIGTRPCIDAIGTSRLSDTGMVVSVPKITTNSTVAVTAEAGTPSNTGIVSSYVNVDVKKYAGQQTYSLELLQRSGPDFYQAMLRNLTKAYAKATDAAVIAEITANGTQASTTAATSAGIISFVSTEVPLAYSATGEVPTAYVAGTSQWGLLMGAVDSTGRPIYNAIAPSNAAGQSSPTSLRGNVLGLDLWVDANMVATTIDESAFILVPSAVYIAESPVTMLSVNSVSTGEIQMSMSGYLATKVLVAGGCRRFNLT